MGNTHPSISTRRKRSSAIAVLSPYHDYVPSGGGSLEPGSPLHYGPQSELHPPYERGLPGKDTGFSEPAEPNKVPIVLSWLGGGTNVELQGSFDNWGSRQPMQLTSAGHTLVKLLAPGVYQYKFIVDGEWRYAADQAAVLDEMGNVNNVVEVHEYEPDMPGNIAGFDPPPSPPESYNCPFAERTDFQKDPPIMPPQLALTLLNVPQATQDGPTCLPRPQHVVLNHLYAQNSAAARAVMFGTTTRYKAKYITTVLYKPVKSQARSESV
mmetsp:Transcript_1205/g.3514  ORF Transcript_1205/g.3514 Transcript_1205/m.3514 type:complete len:267 (+) Transcript_1205:887-1687(+)